MSLKSTPRSREQRAMLGLSVVILILSAVIAGGAVFAAMLNLGTKEDFFLYKFLLVSRREATLIALFTIVASSMIAISIVFKPQYYFFLRDLTINLVLLIITVVLCIITFEIGFRIVYAIPILPIENQIAKETALLQTESFAKHHENLGWIQKPNVSYMPSDPDSSFTTGERGIRMNSTAIKPIPVGAILAVGDSFTVGSEVGDTQSWPAQLERNLDEPVVNAGVGGWASDQIVLRAEELADVYKPKTVILSFLADDIQRSSFKVYASANKPWFDLDSNGDLVRHNDPVPVFTGKPTEVGFSPLGYFHIITFTLDRLGLGEWLRRGTEYVRNGNEPVAVSCRLLERAKKTIADSGIRLIFVLQYGGDPHFDKTQQKPHSDKVVACARAAGIETIDTWSPLLNEFQKGLPEFKKLFVMHDDNSLFGHMSAKGNALIADLIARKLEK